MFTVVYGTNMAAVISLFTNTNMAIYERHHIENPLQYH